VARKIHNTSKSLIGAVGSRTVTPGKMKRFVKKKPFNAAGEVDYARSKLDDLLAHISKGDIQDDDEEEEDDGTDSSPQMKRRRARAEGKLRKGSKEDGTFKPSSCVLKLFERSVDLAQFSYTNTSEDAPLYPICRAWIRNNTPLPTLYEPPQVPEEADEDLDTSGPHDEKPGIFHLPRPLSRPRDSETGREIDLRIPKSVREHERVESTVDTQINSMAEESVNELLSQNMNHWKKVRQDWKEAALENEHRYKHSCDVLKAMYERSVGQQSEMNVA